MRRIYQHTLVGRRLGSISRRQFAVAHIGVTSIHIPIRTFFGVFAKEEPRRLREPFIEPGYSTLLDFRTAAKECVRPPPTADLVQGFRKFFNYKSAQRKRVNPLQASLACELLSYLEETQYSSKEQLSILDLRRAQDTLLSPPDGSNEQHLALLKQIFNSLRALTGGKDSIAELRPHIAGLCQYGASLEALELLSAYKDENQPHGPSWEELWALLLRGLAKEEKETELLEQAQTALAAGFKYTIFFHETMTTFYTRKNDLEGAKKWFERPIVGGSLPTAATYLALLDRAEAASSPIDWIQTAFQQLWNSGPQSDLWAPKFRWAILQGKGEDELKRLIVAEVQRNASNKQPYQSDIENINKLVRIASDYKMHLLAERVIQLAIDLGLSPDQRTYSLQLENRIDANDLSGAISSFELLRANVKLPAPELPVVDKYIRFLCSSKYDLNRVLDVLDTVGRLRLGLEARTFVTLCRIFLRHDDKYEVIDILSLYSVQFSLEERQIVRELFVEYCIDAANSTARAWDAYGIMRQFFPETRRAERIRIMEGFFRRKRADMATQVFGHMRQSANSLVRPAAVDYVRCYEGLGRVPDPASLKIVHNMMKMDMTIQMNTQMYNALMIAYTACGNPDRALEYWTDITNSVEGPTYNSLEIVFWACQRSMDAIETAKRIWAQIQRMDIDIPSSVHTSYVAALAGQLRLQEVEQAISGMQESVGYGPDILT
jgi:hypothetical protein